MESIIDELDMMYEKFFQEQLQPEHFDDQDMKSLKRVIYAIIYDDPSQMQDAASLSDMICNIYLKSTLPYIIVLNHLNCIQNELTHIFLKKQMYQRISLIFQKYDTLKAGVGSCYLAHYLERLQSSNQIRLIRLSDLIQKNLLVYYEAHILWLEAVAESIKHNNVGLLQHQDANECIFGQWLGTEGKAIISNNSKFDALNNLHQMLHHHSHQIESTILSKNNTHHLSYLSHLEKMEMLSLEIGTELALIETSSMITKAAKDPLTGVLNRSLLEQIFHNQYEVAIATENHFVMAMCDLDHFKVINDTHGHLAGDLVLQSFAKIFKQELRNSDVIIRYGGEEFILILPASNLDQAKTVLDKIRVSFHKTNVSYQGTSIASSVSIGIVQVSPQLSMSHDVAFKHYLALADKNLYLAKSEGRNRVK
jgi:diguanylate cyclase (GGDEF)-like protein